MHACTKTSKPSVPPPPIPPVVPPPTVVKPTDVWFELDSIEYNFLKDATDSTTTVRFIARAKGATGYKWDFGDGQYYPTKDSIIKHTYKYTRRNRVYLYAKNNAGETISTPTDTTINVYNGGITLFMNPLQSALFYNPNILAASTGSIEIKKGTEQKLFSMSFLTQPNAGTSLGAFFFNSPDANIEMFPNVLFNFILQKKTSATSYVNAGQYNDVTAKDIWYNLPNADPIIASKTSLLNGEIKRIRILKTTPPTPDNVQLYFFGELIKK